MRAVVTRVKSAGVTIAGEKTAAIGPGFLVLLGVGTEDGPAQADKIADRICGQRVFEDENGKMNRSVQDVGGEVLVVSQFTLLGDARRGNRPSFIEAARPEEADALYEEVVRHLREAGLPCGTGVFRADMQVELVNDGPVTILYDTRRLF